MHLTAHTFSNSSFKNSKASIQLNPKHHLVSDSKTFYSQFSEFRDVKLPRHPGDAVDQCICGCQSVYFGAVVLHTEVEL